ncbi:MAG: phytanoyl-CoA dioxygenase family protein [Gammaproteobacteria bacterium]|nr:phytanoyl-CoA dioxygenase family protein [Gammaproteobacteria bacterium]
MPRPSHLTDEEKFRFDLQGYLIVKNVLSRHECQELSDIADEVWPRTQEDGAFRRTGAISRWHQRYLDLADHPKLLPYLIELLGSRVRLDHDYCIFMQKDGAKNMLHGGPRIHESDHWYHYSDGIMRNGLTVATYALTDAEVGDGGFACVPGSHKTNFLKHFPRDVASFDRVVDYVYQPAIEAGDVLIFTEALIHGTATWRAKHERRALLYKYSPPHSRWGHDRYDHADYPNATAQQRRLMAPPSVYAHPPVVQEDDV